jgi:hypothetical protein
LEVVIVSEPTLLRQTANDIARAAGTLTMQAFDAGGDMAQLQADLATLKGSADICRRMARRIEAQAAQLDDKAPLCLGCHHRLDSPGSPTCEIGLDTDEATKRRTCPHYAAE